MLIICSGEDSYRALQKARELEAAFRQKYDPSGAAVERLAPGKEGVEQLLIAATGGSLFSSHRFFRVDNLLSSCPKARVSALLSVLDRDVEQTIIVTVEEGELVEKILKPFSKTQKLIHYPFATQSPAAFLKWASEYGKTQGVSDDSAIKQIADRALGDSWVFVNELMKWKANGGSNGGPSQSLGVTNGGGEAPSIYDVIDRLLMRRADRWSSVRAFDDANAVVASVVTQARSLLLVHAGKSSSVHPYVAQKLSRMRVENPAEIYARLATAFAWSRTGKASAEEVLDVMG